MSQEPKSDQIIKKWIGETYPFNFKIFAKSDVNGKYTNEVYSWLRLNSSLGHSSGEADRIPWNFSKFLVSGDGKVLKYCAPGVSPRQMEDGIFKALTGERLVKSEEKRELNKPL